MCCFAHTDMAVITELDAKQYSPISVAHWSSQRVSAYGLMRLLQRLNCAELTGEQ